MNLREVINESLGDRLIQLRRDHELTQKQLAEKLGTTERQIQRWEATSYQSIALHRLIKLIEVLQD